MATEILYKRVEQLLDMLTFANYEGKLAKAEKILNHLEEELVT